MSHDGGCEARSTITSLTGIGCRCASRAYAADPLPADTLPVVGTGALLAWVK